MTKICKDGSGDAVWIELNAPPQTPIDWKEAIASAKNAASCGQKIFWELRLGLSEPFFPIDDEMRLSELCLVLKHFSDQIYPIFEDATFGVALYRGPLDLTERFFWSERQKENYAAWKEENKGSSPAFFCLDTLAAYFQLLAHKLPDSLPVFALFDGAGLSRVEALRLLSKERFQHFELAAKGVGSSSWCLKWENESISHSESRFGVVLPNSCDPALFEGLLESMDALSLAYRVVNESFITEEWDGLEAMIAPALSSRGARMLRGFSASGGVVIYVNEPFGIADEISLEEFRGRGIRTPDLLVPNQPR